MKKYCLFLLCLCLFKTGYAQTGSLLPYPETWANWERRMEGAFDEFGAKKLPGETVGILIPSDMRQDILPLTTYGYEVLEPPKNGTLVLLLPAPENYPLNGIVMPEMDFLFTSFGQFHVDDYLKTLLQNLDYPIFLDDAPFQGERKSLIETQLAALKFSLRGAVSKTKILPIMVHFQDANAQVKDLGPFIAETIKDNGLEEFVKFIILANLTKANSERALIATDDILLEAFRNLDVEETLRLRALSYTEDAQFTNPDFDSLALGLLIVRWLGADHGETLAYAHSGQLVLTKNKREPLSYATVGFASHPPFRPKIPHVKREKLLRTFDELFRSDLLNVTRQTAASILDATAAKPPSLLQKQASKKWPIYITLYTPEGQVAGEKGSHIPIGPLEESIRQFTFQAVQAAKPELSKDNFSSYVVELSIPHGFNRVENPEQLIPLLNGIVVHKKQKQFAFHPNNWRVYPNPHQLLGAICFKLGLKPWDYATRKAKIESFRTISFNEKEPFQDLNVNKKSKGKKKKDDEFDDLEEDGNFDGVGGFPF